MDIFIPVEHTLGIPNNWLPNYSWKINLHKQVGIKHMYIEKPMEREFDLPLYEFELSGVSKISPKAFLSVKFEHIEFKDSIEEIFFKYK